MSRSLCPFFLIAIFSLFFPWGSPAVLSAASLPATVVGSISQSPDSAVAELFVVEVVFEVPVLGVDAADRLRFNQLPRIGYILESTPALPEVAWQPVSSSSQSDATGAITILIPTTQNTLFYRVRTP